MMLESGAVAGPLLDHEIGRDTITPSQQDTSPAENRIAPDNMRRVHAPPRIVWVDIETPGNRPSHHAEADKTNGRDDPAPERFPSATRKDTEPDSNRSRLQAPIVFLNQQRSHFGPPRPEDGNDAVSANDPGLRSSVRPVTEPVGTIPELSSIDDAPPENPPHVANRRMETRARAKPVSPVNISDDAGRENETWESAPVTLRPRNIRTLVPVAPKPTEPGISAPEQSSSTRTIEVRIGRIEIKAVTPPREPAPVRPSVRKDPALSLDNYLKQRSEESR